MLRTSIVNNSMGMSRLVTESIKAWLSMKKAELKCGPRCWTVLCLHEVKDREAFSELLSRLQDLYRLTSLSEGFELLRSGSLIEPMLTLTLDDADKTVWQNCLPELQRRSIPACLYVCTGFVDKGFRDVSTGRHPVMTWENLKDWADAGLEVGSHTVNHIPLNQATLERSKWEILESKRVLEERLECEVRSFAYPWGYFKKDLDDWLQSDGSFSTICTTIPRDNYPDDQGKRIYRKPDPIENGGLRKALTNPTLYETIRAGHQQSVLNSLAPVLWRLDEVETTAKGEERVRLLL